MQDLNDVFYFVQVLEQGSFTAAGRALGVAKSQLSFRIARLEQMLGVRLIQRTTRRLHATDIGRLYYEQCRNMLAAANEAQRVIDEAQGVPRGRIHVGCPVMFAEVLLAPVLSAYLEQHPEVQVDVSICDHQADVIAGGYDIVFRVLPVVKDSSLVARSFGMDPHVLVASPRLVQRLGIPRRPKDLARFPALSVLSDNGRYFFNLRGRDGQTHSIETHPRLVSDDLHVLYQAAVRGIGIAELPQFLVRKAVKDGELTLLLPSFGLQPVNVHAVYPSRHGITPAVRSFIDFVTRTLPGELDSVQHKFYNGSALH